MGVREGRLGGELPYYSLGSGPPLVVIAGLSPTHENPRGLMLRFGAWGLKQFAEHFTVYEVNRKPGLAAGATMSDIAADYASAFDKEFGEPIPVIGVSTGGSVGLQLAIDHPDALQRLILAGAACRLSDVGRQVQLDTAARAAAGDTRGAWRVLGGELFERPWAQRVAGAVFWVIGPALLGSPTRAGDMVITIHAEDAFDVTAQLGRISCPTLLICGSKDRFYNPELFRRTADGIPNAQLRMYEGKGHVGAMSDKRYHRDALEFLGVH